MTTTLRQEPLTPISGTGARPAPADPRDPWLRLAALLDEGSVQALHAADDSGVLAVRGAMGGVAVIAFCTDAARMGGAMGRAGCAHITAAIDRAVLDRVPVIGLWHSGGARLGEGIGALDGVGAIFAAMVRASGVVFQLSVVLGPAAGGAAYGPALTDVVVMSDDARLFVTGPDVVRSVTGEDATMESLGGPAAHGRKSGVAHVVTATEAEAYERARGIIGLVADQGAFGSSPSRSAVELRSLLPQRRQRAYDVRPLVTALLDPDTGFEELQQRWAPNVLVGFGRLAGRTVGVVANNPIHKAGCLDSRSAEKSARFVRTCDAFGIPLVVLVDVPGYLPGLDEEWGGVVRRGAKLLHAFAEAVVPRVTVVTRKSFGGAYIAMNAHSLGATAVYAWDDAEVAVMGAEAAVEILHRKRLAGVDGDAGAQLRRELVQEHRDQVSGLGHGVSIGAIDEVIDPATTRHRVVAALAGAPQSRGRHRNIPL